MGFHLKLRSGKNSLERAEKTQQAYYTASQWRLMWRRLRRHKLAMIGGTILLLFYLSAIFAPFLSPYDPHEPFDEYLNAPPQVLRFWDENGFSLRPFVYGLKGARDPKTLARIFEVNKEQRCYINFFVRGSEYKILGFIPGNIHLFGPAEKDNTVFLFGTDNLGRDLFSRNMHASQVSLTIGLVGVFFSFVLGCTLGGISGYYGGVVDMIIQRIIEFLLSIPTLPLWMALSAALPRDWSQMRIYFAITLILALASWTGLARVVRGKLISTRNQDFVMAAKVAGSSEGRIIYKHLLPDFMGYLIVNLTMSIPGMILGETSLSFLGLGLQAPIISWGVLLNQAQNVRTVALYPWIMLPAIFVVLAVLSFNFIGDGLRDAADPYKEV